MHMHQPWPVRGKMCACAFTTPARIDMTHHISALIKHISFNTLRGHPFNRDLLLTPSPAAFRTIVVKTVHVLSQSKIGHFYDTISINPSSNRGAIHMIYIKMLD